MSKDIPIKLRMNIKECIYRNSINFIVEYRKPRMIFRGKKQELSYNVNGIFTDEYCPELSLLYKEVENTLDGKYKGDLEPMLNDILKTVILERANGLKVAKEQQLIRDRFENIACETNISLEDLRLLEKASEEGV